MAFVFFLPTKEAFELLLVIGIIFGIILILFWLFTPSSVDEFNTRRLFFIVEKDFEFDSEFVDADLFCLKFGTHTSFCTFRSS